MELISRSCCLHGRESALPAGSGYKQGASGDLGRHRQAIKMITNKSLAEEERYADFAE
jgi:hypothetical protein